MLKWCTLLVLLGAALVASSSLLAGTSLAAKTCVAPSNTRTLKKNSKAIVWIRTTREGKSLRRSYFGCAFSKRKTIRIVWTLREPDDSNNCGGTILSHFALKGHVVTYTEVSSAGNEPAFRSLEKARVNLSTGRRQLLDSTDNEECA